MARLNRRYKRPNALKQSAAYPVEVLRHYRSLPGERRSNPVMRRNALERDADHPIEVTRHYRAGGPGYLSAWQRAAAIGQNELFSTGIKLSSRAAEMRGKRKNPGVTKAAYRSGLKEATAAQLGKLTRIGLRTGHTVTEIKADLKATGRFTAAQIARGVEQAREAEKRQNPRRGTRRYVGSASLKSAARAIDSPRALLLRDLVEAGEASPREINEWNRLQDTFTGRALRTVGQSRRNPGGKAKRQTTELYERFSGKRAKRQNSVSAPAGTPANVAKLGALRLIETADGRKWKFNGAAAPILAADHKQRLHVVGGRYRANPAGEECGEIVRVEYETDKPHLGQPTPAIYFHELGEETGERPTLRIDEEGLLHIDGGAYHIEADGIHN